MAEITAQAVNEFRKKTGLGLMECKALLKEADGDLEGRDPGQGARPEEGRAAPGRAAKAGRIEVYIHHDAKSGVMVELKCETDFVAPTTSSSRWPRTWRCTSWRANPMYMSREDVPGGRHREEGRSSSRWPTSRRTSGKRSSRGSSTAGTAKRSSSTSRSSRTTRRRSGSILSVNARTGENISVGRFARFVVGEGR